MDSDEYTQDDPGPGRPYGESATAIPSYQAWVSAAFQNEMSSAFVLQAARFAIDGKAVCSLAGERLDEVKAFGAFEGAIAPGEHLIEVQLVYSGHGNGVFSYLKGYRFNVRSSHRLEAAGGEQMRVLVVGREKGGATTPLEDRPQIEFKVWSSRRR
jgi:hypothetical protein